MKIASLGRLLIWEPFQGGVREFPYRPIAKIPLAESHFDSKAPETGSEQDGITHFHVHKARWSGASVQINGADQPEPTVTLQWPKSNSAAPSARAVAMPYRYSHRPEFNRGFPYHGYTGLSNSDAMNFARGFGLSTGLVLSVSSPTPGAEASVFVQMNNYGYDKLLVHKIRVPSQATTIRIPWWQFQEYPLKEFDAVLQASGIIYNKDHFGFLTETPELSLTLHGPVIFERDIQNSSQLRKILRKYVPFLGATNFESALPEPPGWRDFESTEEILARAIDRLFQKEDQEYALGLSDLGAQAVFAKLREIDFVEQVLKDEVGNNGFFSGDLNTVYQTNSQGVKFRRPLPLKPRVAIESGEFAFEHGELAHALQILTMTRGMSAHELAIFRYMYSSIFVEHSNMKPAWLFWDVVFDAPGNFAANAPRWWRDQVEKRARKIRRGL